MPAQHVPGFTSIGDAANGAVEGKASSLGARLCVALSAGFGVTTDFHRQLPTVQAAYERAAVSFVASLTYAESEGVREALLSSVLVDAIKAHIAARTALEGASLHSLSPDDYRFADVNDTLDAMRAAVAQAEAR